MESWCKVGNMCLKSLIKWNLSYLSNSYIFQSHSLYKPIAPLILWICLTLGTCQRRGGVCVFKMLLIPMKTENVFFFVLEAYILSLQFCIWFLLNLIFNSESFQLKIFSSNQFVLGVTSRYSKGNVLKKRWIDVKGTLCILIDRHFS